MYLPTQPSMQKAVHHNLQVGLAVRCKYNEKNEQNNYFFDYFVPLLEKIVSG